MLLQPKPLVQAMRDANIMRACLAPTDAVPMLYEVQPASPRNRKTSVPYAVQSEVFEAAELKRARKSQKLAILAGQTVEDEL